MTEFPGLLKRLVFLRLAAERCMALGCLQAVITRLQLLTQPKFPGQAAQEHEPWMLRYSVSWRANCCRCRSDPQFIFYKDVSSNYVAGPHTHTDSSWRSLWNVLPPARLLKYTNRTHSVNQKWKAIRWDIEYVPAYNSSVHVARTGTIRHSRCHTAPCSRTEETSLLCRLLL